MIKSKISPLLKNPNCELWILSYLSISWNLNSKSPQFYYNPNCTIGRENFLTVLNPDWQQQQERKGVSSFPANTNHRYAAVSKFALSTFGQAPHMVRRTGTKICKITFKLRFNSNLFKFGINIQKSQSLFCFFLKPLETKVRVWVI